MKKVFAVLLSVLLLGTALCACTPKEKTFTYAGFTITLDSSFRLTDDTHYTTTLVSKQMAVFALREDFSQQMNADTLSVHDYAYLVLRNNHAEKLEIQEDDGLTWFERDYEEKGSTLHYYTFCYKAGTTTFWMVQFACKDTEAEALRDTVFAAAKTIVVTP